MKKRTYCNPLDLNYEYRVYENGNKKGPICLEAADPVMVVPGKSPGAQWIGRLLSVFIDNERILGIG